MTQKRIISTLAAAAFSLLGMVQIALADGACGEECCKKVCRPTTEVKKVPHRCYTDACEDFCLPRCGPLSGLFGHKEDCGSCADGHCGDGHCGTCASCGRVRLRKVLIVKVRTCEECIPACVVECQAPACPTAPCGAPVINVPPSVQTKPLQAPVYYSQPMPIGRR